jgi:hypothetical protein
LGELGDSHLRDEHGNLNRGAVDESQEATASFFEREETEETEWGIAAAQFSPFPPVKKNKSERVSM